MPNRVDQYIKNQKKSSDATLASKSHLQKLSTASPKQGRRNFSPLNLLSSGMSSSNKNEDSNAFRTMTSFFGKAMEALGIEDSDGTDNDPITPSPL